MRKHLGILVLAGAVGLWQWAGVSTPSSARPVRTLQPRPMEDIAHERREAFAQLNILREAMGMPTMQENAALQKAAQAHADYLVTHHLSSHFEQHTRSGFTGTKPMDRALRAGYPSRFVGENLSTASRHAIESVEGLFSAIYHRFGFLNLSFDEVGIGIAQHKHDTKDSAFVYLMGDSATRALCAQPGYAGGGRYVYGVCADTSHRIAEPAYRHAQDAIKTRNPRIVVYPYAGQTDVPPAFYDEHPDPLPDYDVSGFPVSVEFNDRYFRKVTLVSFRLFEAGGHEVTRVRLLDKRSDPNGKLTRRQFALLPLERLAYATTYRVELVYRHRGKRHTKRWSFTTRKPPEKLHTIRGDQTTLTLHAGQGYWLYFVPRDPHDVLGTMQFPRDLYVEFVDRNTMRIVLDEERTRDFVITGSGRTVRVRVE